MVKFIITFFFISSLLAQFPKFYKTETYRHKPFNCARYLTNADLCFGDSTNITLDKIQIKSGGGPWRSFKDYLYGIPVGCFTYERNYNCQSDSVLNGSIQWPNDGADSLYFKLIQEEK